jgi:electron transfer flavoprotein alpha subunit
VPSAQQVGFSGQKISPDLYLRSASPARCTTWPGSPARKTIVAINKDRRSRASSARPRFGVVGDANEVVPAFVARVKELRAGRG